MFLNTNTFNSIWNTNTCFIHKGMYSLNNYRHNVIIHTIIITRIITNGIWSHILKPWEGKSLQHICFIVSDNVRDLVSVIKHRSCSVRHFSYSVSGVSSTKWHTSNHHWLQVPSHNEVTYIIHQSNFASACWTRDWSWHRSFLPLGVAGKGPVVFWWSLQVATCWWGASYWKPNIEDQRCSPSYRNIYSPWWTGVTSCQWGK